jgi:hypothetical protein
MGQLHFHLRRCSTGEAIYYILLYICDIDKPEVDKLVIYNGIIYYSILYL